VCNLLDECFRQTQAIADPSSIPIHLAFGIEAYVPTALREIRSICNTPDRQLLRRFVDELSYLIRIHQKVKDKYVLRYYVPHWMRDFFFDPNRCRHLYSTSLVIYKCQKAIKNLILDPYPDFYDDLVYFFTPTPTPSGEIPIGNIANATHLLKSATNGSDRNALLLFLAYLSEIHWFDIYNRGQSRRHFANRIIHWVCTTLVG
jgi:hypothetical protein